MADTKISDLTALTAPAVGDLIPIVDISEADTAIKIKHITYANLVTAGWTAYTPTGISATNVTLHGRYMKIGKLCWVDITCAFTGAITFTTHPSLPFTAGASIPYGTAHRSSGSGAYLNADTGYALQGLVPTVERNATTVILYDPAGVEMSASAPITWANDDAFDIHFWYETV